MLAVVIESKWKISRLSAFIYSSPFEENEIKERKFSNMLQAGVELRK